MLRSLHSTASTHQASLRIYVFEYKEGDRRLDFRVQGRHRVETHVGLVLIDRLLTALANRLDDPTANLRKAKPW